jgi:hypothetical protein
MGTQVSRKELGLDCVPLVRLKAMFQITGLVTS